MSRLIVAGTLAHAQAAAAARSWRRLACGGWLDEDGETVLYVHSPHQVLQVRHYARVYVHGTFAEHEHWAEIKAKMAARNLRWLLLRGDA